jgi:hypothetical protein
MFGNCCAVPDLPFAPRSYVLVLCVCVCVPRTFVFVRVNVLLRVCVIMDVCVLMTVHQQPALECGR